ncbi:MAG TPA: hypothetical protein VK436_05620 [Methanocella sp.]|nr:hypothetical protein [Methanocella sp.]
MMHVKGHVISYLPSFLVEKFGRYGMDMWMYSLSKQAYDIYSDGVDKNGWYPLDVALTSPMDIVCETFYHNSLRGAIEFGRYVADKERSWEVRFFPIGRSLQSKLKKACITLQSHYDSATIISGTVNDDSAVIQVTHFPENNEILEVINAGWIQRTLGQDGRHQVAIELKAQPENSSNLVYLVKLKKPEQEVIRTNMKMKKYLGFLY